MSTARGMFSGMDAIVTNDSEGLTWPGGCEPLAESFLDIDQRAPKLLEYFGNGSNSDFFAPAIENTQNACPASGGVEVI